MCYHVARGAKVELLKTPCENEDHGDDEDDHGDGGHCYRRFDVKEERDAEGEYLVNYNGSVTDISAMTTAFRHATKSPVRDQSAYCQWATVNAEDLVKEFADRAVWA